MTSSTPFLEGFLGSTERFGIVHVGLESQMRTVKTSGWWYRDTIRSNGAPIAALDVAKADAR